MSLEEALAKNTAAVEANTAMLKALLERNASAKVGDDAQHGSRVAGSAAPASAPAAGGKPADTAAATALTYKEVSEAFLKLIKKLGTAAKAKAAVLDPLGLSDLKSNESKPDLFPAIMEKINKAMADTGESLV